MARRSEYSDTVKHAHNVIARAIRQHHPISSEHLRAGRDHLPVTETRLESASHPTVDSPELLDLLAKHRPTLAPRIEAIKSLSDDEDPGPFWEDLREAAAPRGARRVRVPTMKINGTRADSFRPALERRKSDGSRYGVVIEGKQFEFELRLGFHGVKRSVEKKPRVLNASDFPQALPEVLSQLAAFAFHDGVKASPESLVWYEHNGSLDKRQYIRERFPRLPEALEAIRCVMWIT